MSAITTTNSVGIEPANMSELRALAQAAAASRFFGAQTPEQALMVMMAGRDLGLSYPQALRAFHVIDGKPSLSAQGMVAVCLQSGKCEYFEVQASSDTSATVVAKRINRPERSVTFTLDDARRAGLVGKGNWAKYPRSMLVARAQAALAREMFPDMLLGLYTDDEQAGVAASSSPPPVAVEVETPSPVPALLEQLAVADSLEALRQVGEHVRSLGLAGADRRAVADAYRAREAELRAAAPVVEAVVEAEVTP